MKKLIIILFLFIMLFDCRTVYDSLEGFRDYKYKATILQAEYYPNENVYWFEVGFADIYGDVIIKKFSLYPNGDEVLIKVLQSRRFNIFVHLYWIEGIDATRERYYIDKRLLKQNEYTICK